MTSNVQIGKPPSGEAYFSTKKAEKNVLYLTWGETIGRNGIFDNQVLELLKQLVKTDDTLRLTLLSGIPFINQRLLSDRKQFFTEMEAIERQLNDNRIDFAYRWIPAVARWFHSQPYQFPFYSVGQQQFLFTFLTSRNIQTIHCRGYHATRLALLTRKKYGENWQIIFDTRGLFPEEGVYAGHFSAQSNAYRVWKKVERHLLDEADAIVNVSTTFSTYIRTITSNASIHTIHTTTNLAIFSGKSAERESVRQSLKIPDGTKVLVYLGSIGADQGWHRIASLIALFQAFQQTFPEALLLIITRSAQEQLRAELDQNEATRNRYQIVAGRTPLETASYLAAGDCGALPYRPVNTKIEQQIGYTMIASKTGEYLAAGLPLLVNRAIGAASELAEERGLGCTYSIGNEQTISQQLRELLLNETAVRQRAIEAAEALFSTQGNAIRYLKLYEQLSQ